MARIKRWATRYRHLQVVPTCADVPCFFCRKSGYAKTMVAMTRRRPLILVKRIQRRRLCVGSTLPPSSAMATGTFGDCVMCEFAVCSLVPFFVRLVPNPLKLR